MAVETDDLTTLLTSASLITVASVVGSSSKLFERVIMARFLHPDAYGQVSVGISLMTISVTVGLLGLDEGVAHYVPRYETVREKRGSWLAGLIISILLAAAIVFVLLATPNSVISKLFGSVSSELMIVLFIFAIPFITGMRVAIGTIQGFENTVYRLYSRDLFYNVFRLLLLVVLLLLGLQVAAAGAAYLVAAIVTFVVAHYFLNRLLPLCGESTFHVRELVNFSTPLMVAGSVSVLLAQMDTLMLSYFDTLEAVSQYNTAYPLAAGQSVILSSFGFMYYPLTSRLNSSGKSSEIKSIYMVTTKWTFVLGFPFFVLLVVFPEDLIAIIFGQQYIGGALALSILSAGMFSKAAIGRCQDTLSAFGYTRAILVINVSALVLNVMLNVLFIPLYGAVGAAIASAISFFGLNGFAFVVMILRSGIHPFSKWTIRTYTVLPLTVLPSAYLLSQYADLTLFTVFPIGIAVTIATVVVLAFSGSLQSEDEIALELIENAIGLRVPFLRRFIPDNETEVDSEI